MNNPLQVAFIGNPNTGKTSLFNALTHLNHHTGNWPGKTVKIIKGKMKNQKDTIHLTDTPGTYSINGLSEEEKVTRSFLYFTPLDCIVVVCDALTLERNLNLVLEAQEINSKVILVINQIDQAEKKGVKINALKLEYYLGIPVIFTSAKKKIGLQKLKDTISLVGHNQYHYHSIQFQYNTFFPHFDDLNQSYHNRYFTLNVILNNQEFMKEVEEKNHLKLQTTHHFNGEENLEKLMNIYYQTSQEILSKSVVNNEHKLDRDKRIDDVLTSRRWGIPIMLLILALLFYITIVFANIPSSMLFNLFFGLEEKFFQLLVNMNLPIEVCNTLCFGMYRTLAWVVSVMLPPMMIFFPIFTFLEDLGYLPRVAYNLDPFFQKCGSHGKQCLSMCMGLGCNASGVIGTRIIENKRERMIAILTNNFMLCNGRFPTVILLGTIFTASTFAFLNQLSSLLIVTILILFGIVMTFYVSKILSRTIMKGEKSSFTLELPSYKFPSLYKVFVRAFLDKTLKVLWRAVIVCIPFGILIYVFKNYSFFGINLLDTLVHFFNPLGKLLGLDGVIVLAFLLGLPANEIVFPILLMLYMNQSHMIDFDNVSLIKNILIENHWTVLTVINFLILILFHFPCATTLYTIKKETKSLKYTLFSFILPTLIGILLCLLSTGIFHIFK